MFEWMFAHWEQLVGVAVAVAALFGYRVHRTRRIDAAVNAAIAMAEAERIAAIPKRCDTCANWDHEEGQASLRAEPRFWNEVAPHVSPQRMMERYDTDGNLLPQPVKLLAKENSWGAYGYCMANENLTHCAFGDKCPKWKAKAQ